MDDTRIRPEVRALAERGNVTLSEWQAFRGNSWEIELMIPALDNEAFAHVARHWAENCQIDPRRPFVTYNDAVPGLLVPELLRRLEAVKALADALEAAHTHSALPGHIEAQVRAALRLAGR